MRWTWGVGKKEASKPVEVWGRASAGMGGQDSGLGAGALLPVGLHRPGPWLRFPEINFLSVDFPNCGHLTGNKPQGLGDLSPPL